MQRNIAVIFGGVSNENEISVITGTMALNVLKSGGDTVIPLYLSQQGELFTGAGLADINNFKHGGFKVFPRALFAEGGIFVMNKRGRPKKFVRVDAALNCCHGGYGEGGGICGLCALNKIPLASAGIFESAAFMDKYYTKLVLSALGVNIAPYAYIRNLSDFAAAEELGYPLIVKPAKLGSSIGVERADDRAALECAVESAFFYDDGVLAEKYFEDKREINCAAYYSGGEVITSECEEALSGSDIFSFDDKYTGSGKSVLPAHIPEATAEKIKNFTAEVYSKLNMRGIVRFDYILSGGEIYLSEINTVPGSFSYYLLSSGFKDFYPVLQAVIIQAEEDFRKSSEKKILSTGILDNLPPNGCKFGKK